MTELDSEPKFQEDLEDMEKCATEALNAICEIKAYTLTPEELRDLKAAQYALRNLVPDKDGYSGDKIGDLYE